MAKTTVYVVSDEYEQVDKVKNTLAATGVTVTSYNSAQWKEGLENPFFRSQLTQGLPTLAVGSGQSEVKSNVLPFPGVQVSNEISRVATMDELESKAIENAIAQFRGNLTEAAKALGIGRATLYRKVKQYQIDPSAARRKRAA